MDIYYIWWWTLLENIFFTNRQNGLFQAAIHPACTSRLTKIHHFYRRPSVPPIKMIFAGDLSIFAGTRSTCLKNILGEKKIPRHHSPPAAVLPFWLDLGLGFWVEEREGEGGEEWGGESCSHRPPAAAALPPPVKSRREGGRKGRGVLPPSPPAVAATTVALLLRPDLGGRGGDRCLWWLPPLSPPSSSQICLPPSSSQIWELGDFIVYLKKIKSWCWEKSFS